MSVFGRYPERPVRPYMVTGGRASGDLKADTLLITTGDGKPLPVSASSEQRALVRMCRRLLSLVEAAAYLELPVSAVSVLASDLVGQGFLAMHCPGPVPSREEMLQEVLDGLQKLI
jgi:hypothetical protein